VIVRLPAAIVVVLVLFHEPFVVVVVVVIVPDAPLVVWIGTATVAVVLLPDLVELVTVPSDPAVLFAMVTPPTLIVAQVMPQPRPPETVIKGAGGVAG
jgi:hypothetical protein